MKWLFGVSVFATTLVAALCTTPIVLWHGIGDTCCFSFSIGYVKSMLEKEIPGVYVYSIRIGDSIEEDFYNSYLKNVNDQIEEVCRTLSSDENLKDGFHAVGFSQGAQFLRGLIQRCVDIKVINYISMGGQHQGVYGLPRCQGLLGLCELTRKLLSYGAYISLIQDKLVPAEYWHDPFNEEEYQMKSIFLADINNENNITVSYPDQLLKLKTMVLVKFKRDTIVIPKESSHFEFYIPGQDQYILPLKNSSIYTEGRLGLQLMIHYNQLKFLEVDGDHLQFTDVWFKENIIYPYLM